jgi:hypothetical protein
MNPEIKSEPSAEKPVILTFESRLAAIIEATEDTAKRNRDKIPTSKGRGSSWTNRGC